MRRSKLMIGALALYFAGGFGLAEEASSRVSTTDVQASPACGLPCARTTSDSVLPVAAQQAWFPPVRDYFTEVLEDEKFNTLLGTLEQRMAAKETLADFEREAGYYLRSFSRRIAAPKLRPAQIQEADDYLLRLARQHPKHRLMIEKERRLLKESAGVRNPLLAFLIPDTLFPDARTLNTGGEPFAEGTIDKLIDVLDAVLTVPENVFLSNSNVAAEVHLRRFIHRLGHGQITDAQTARINAYLDQVKTRSPDLSKFIDQCRHKVRNLMPGRVAPNIKGRDLGGAEFELSEYRGDIVVLYFSGQWCAPCRSEYPYQRFMLELFKNKPVTILGVNSDDKIETIREAKEREGLEYRVWWDGHGEEPTKGPIATAWDVTGWPTIYILDELGVIRFVEKRYAEVITSVNILLKDKNSSMVQ